MELFFAKVLHANELGILGIPSADDPVAIMPDPFGELYKKYIGKSSLPLSDQLQSLLVKEISDQSHPALSYFRAISSLLSFNFESFRENLNQLKTWSHDYFGNPELEEYLTSLIIESQKLQGTTSKDINNIVLIYGYESSASSYAKQVLRYFNNSCSGIILDHRDYWYTSSLVKDLTNVCGGKNCDIILFGHGGALGFKVSHKQILNRSHLNEVIKKASSINVFDGSCGFCHFAHAEDYEPRPPNSVLFNIEGNGSYKINERYVPMYLKLRNAGYSLNDTNKVASIFVSLTLKIDYRFDVYVKKFYG